VLVELIYNFNELIFYAEVGGLRCHQCDTLLDQRCDDSFWSDPNRTVLNTADFLKACPVDNGANFNACKKVIALEPGVNFVGFNFLAVFLRFSVPRLT
jgi:hypothetical protein